MSARLNVAEKELELRPEVAVLIALSFAIFIDQANAWTRLDASLLSEGMKGGAVSAALHRFKQNIDAIFQGGDA